MAEGGKFRGLLKRNGSSAFARIHGNVDESSGKFVEIGKKGFLDYPIKVSF